MEKPDSIPQRWSSRKFLTMVGLLVLFTVLLVTDNISEQTWMIAKLTVAGAYFGLNVYQHIKGGR